VVPASLLDLGLLLDPGHEVGNHTPAMGMHNEEVRMPFQHPSRIRRSMAMEWSTMRPNMESCCSPSPLPPGRHRGMNDQGTPSCSAWL
jgi:hypothetical protein